MLSPHELVFVTPVSSVLALNMANIIHFQARSTRRIEHRLKINPRERVWHIRRRWSPQEDLEARYPPRNTSMSHTPHPVFKKRVLNLTNTPPPRTPRDKAARTTAWVPAPPTKRPPSHLLSTLLTCPFPTWWLAKTCYVLWKLKRWYFMMVLGVSGETGRNWTSFLWMMIIDDGFW